MEFRESFLRIYVTLSPAISLSLVAALLAGCPPPAETRSAAAVDAGAILTQLEKQGEGLLESWTWEYRVTPEQGALLPEGFDGGRFEAACAGLDGRLSPAAQAKMRTPGAAELVLLSVDRKAETHTWLDPEQQYANEGPFIELHAFTRYRTRASGELLAREFVQRVGSQDGVLEAVTVQDAATGVARVSARDRSGETVHDYPEAAFTPWTFGLSFDPKPLGQRPAGRGLAEWRVELATQASDPDAAGGPSEVPVLLRLRQWRRGGDQDWAATLSVVRLPDQPTAYPAQMAWHRDAALVARVSVDAWLPPTAGHDAMLVASLARRTAPTPPGAAAAEQTVRYHLTAFGPSRENPISASAARKAIESMRAVLETWGNVPSVPVSLGGDPATDPSVDAIRELFESWQEQGGEDLQSGRPVDDDAVSRSGEGTGAPQAGSGFGAWRCLGEESVLLEGKLSERPDRTVRLPAAVCEIEVEPLSLGDELESPAGVDVRICVGRDDWRPLTHERLGSVRTVEEVLLVGDRLYVKGEQKNQRGVYLLAIDAPKALAAVRAAQVAPEERTAVERAPGIFDLGWGWYLMSHNLALSPDARYLIHDSYRPRMTQPDELPHTVWLVDTAEPWSLRRQAYPSTRKPVPSDVGVSQAVTTNFLWSMDGTRVVFVRTPEIPGHGLDDPAGTTLVVVDVADGLDAVAVSEAPVNVLPGRLRWVEDETLAHQPYGAMPGLDETLLNLQGERVPLTARKEDD